MVDRLRLSRSQIAKIVGGDPEAVRQFERLFDSQDASIVDAQSLAQEIAVADNKATAALDALSKLGDPLAPVPAVHAGRVAYGWFSSTADQTAAAINTAYKMTFDTTGEAVDARIGSPASRIYVDRAGLYNIQFSTQFVNTAGGAHQAWVWLAVNGANVANSATVLRLQGNNAETVAAWNFVQRLNAGDYFELAWEVSDTAVSLFADTASAVHPAIPSVLLSVTDNIEARS